MQDKFFTDIKNTWQDVELPHQDLLKKARRNLTLQWCGLAYNAIFTLCSIAFGIWLGLNNQNDALYWSGAFMAIFLIPALTIYSIRIGWPYSNWQDKSAIGTLTTLIKQNKMKITFTRMMRPLAFSYILVPVIGFFAYHLNLTRISYDYIFGFSTGIIASSCVLLLWVHIKLPRLQAELNKLLAMQKEWNAAHLP